MDDQIRNAAFKWLEEQTLTYGDVLPWDVLNKGFNFRGERIIPLGAKGIWKPKSMQLPLSITTSPDSPYNDAFAKNSSLRYKYRGKDPFHPDNVGLREVMRLQKPLIYFLGVIKGKYLAAWPVFIIQDNITDLSFTVAIDDMGLLKGREADLQDPVAAFYRRSYITSNTLVRLHQHSFRERVLLAYHNQCSLCRLRHAELLDAAHIISDKEDAGDPIVQNGLALCKIHHAAFDRNIIGISPDYVIKVRQDILAEIDGPMLKYGIQYMNNGKLILPKRKADWPDRDRLMMRFEGFMKAG